MNCVFCNKYYARDYEHIYSNDDGYDVMRFVPLNPVTSGHRLFVPTDHIEWGYCDAPYAIASAVHFATSWGEGYESFNLITSNGSAATQTIPHIHVHFVPRREGDGLHLPWTGQIKEVTWPYLEEDFEYLEDR